MPEAGVDLSILQKLMGHRDPKTTTQYDRRHEEAKRQALHKPTLP